MDVLKPPPSLLAKVGSILVHAEEATEALRRIGELPA